MLGTAYLFVPHVVAKHRIDVYAAAGTCRGYLSLARHRKSFLA